MPMRRRAIASAAAVLCTVALPCAPALAQDAGTPDPSDTPGGAAYGQPAPGAQPAPTLLAPAGPGGLAISPGAILGWQVLVAGTLPDAAGRTVVVEQSD